VKSDTGRPVTLAFTGICAKCRKTFVSVLREFSAAYVCPDCRPESITAWLATKPRCSRGHLLTSATLRYTANGKQGCRLCQAQLSRESQQRRRAEAKAARS
jgi:hypothetical protein